MVKGRRSHLLSFSDVPDEDVFTRCDSDVASLLSTSQGHVRYVCLLAADDPEHRAGCVAQVLLGQPHDQQSEVMTDSVLKRKDRHIEEFSRIFLKYGE